MIEMYELATKWSNKCNVQVSKITELAWAFGQSERFWGNCNYQGKNVTPFLSRAQSFCNKQAATYGAKDQCKQNATFNRCMNSFAFLKRISLKSGDKFTKLSLPTKDVTTECSKKDQICHKFTIKVATQNEDACKKNIDIAESQKLAQEPFQCQDFWKERSKYSSCNKVFNDIITNANDHYHCLSVIKARRWGHLGRYWHQPTNECTLGLKGWWKKEKFGNKQLTAAEKIEEKVMTATNACLNIIAYKRKQRFSEMRMRRLKNGKVVRENTPFKPNPPIEYTLCVQKILLTVATEEEKLKQSIKFYPNFPNNIESQYLSDTFQNKWGVQNFLRDLETGCKKLSTDSTEDKCEEAKIYNRCIGRASEASMFWNKIDYSIPALLKTVDEIAICESNSEETD